MRKAGEGLGYSPDTGIGLLRMAAAAGVVGAALGNAVGIVRSMRAGRPWKAQAAITAALLIAFGSLGYAQFLGVWDFRSRMHDNLARMELRSMHNALEVFIVDHDRCPRDLGEIAKETTGMVSPDVQFEFSCRPGKPLAFELRAYHRNGKKVFMMRNDSTTVFWRERAVKDDPFLPE